MPYLLTFEEILSKHSLLTSEQITAAIAESKKNGSSLQKVLIQKQLLTEAEILQAVSKELDIPYLPHLSADVVNPELIKKVPARYVTHYQFIPLEEDNETLTVAVNELNIRIYDELKLLLGKEIKFTFVPDKEIKEAIRKYYGIGADTVERMIEENGIEVLQEEQKEDNIEDRTVEASVIKFFNQILVQAIQDRATDVHIEPFENQLRIRYRIDGILFITDIPSTIQYFQAALVSRIKIMAGLNIAEKRLPQDGRIKIKMGKEVGSWNIYNERN